MTAVVIEAELQRQDWAELSAYIGQRAITGEPQFRARAVAVIVVVGIAGLCFALLQLTGQKMGGAATAIGALIGAMAFVLLQRFYTARFRRIGSSAFFGPVRYELDAQGIRFIRAGMNGSVDWTRIEQIDETLTAIYFPLDRLSAYVIPKRAVDATLLPDLVAQLRSWHAERRRASLDEPISASTPAQSVAITRELTTQMPARRFGFFRDLFGNLRAGLKLLTLRRVAPTDFTVSFDQLVALLAIVLALLFGLDWLLADSGAVFDSYALYSWANYLLAGLCAAAIISRFQGRQAQTRALLVTWLAAVPLFIIVLAAVLLLPLGRRGPVMVLATTAILLFVLSERAVRIAFGSVRLGTSVLVVLGVAGVPWIFQTQLYLDPRFWVPPSAEEAFADSSRGGNTTESLLFEQADRIADAVDATAAERPGVADTYFLGFAGWGRQSVFRNEALFGEKVFAQHFHTARRAVELINDDEDRDTYPLATVSGLRYALQLLGERMDKEDDVLVLLITSHGSREDIAVSNGYLPLADLRPDDLRSALDDSGIKWRVVIVSACYAGVFLDPLKSESTLVITAADARHNSFGCADDRDLTYFGEAFLRDALPGTASLEAAFAKARKLIAEREAAEKLTPSNPQIFVGEEIRKKLAAPAGPTDVAPETTVPDTSLTARQVPTRVPGFSGVSE